MLWEETFQLLCQERSTAGDRVLVNHNGTPLKVDELDGNSDSQKKIDNVASSYFRLKRQTGVKKPLKVFRKTSSTLIRSNKHYTSLADLFLGLAPTSIADRHYAGIPQALLDEAITWLGKQYGIEKELGRSPAAPDGPERSACAACMAEPTTGMPYECPTGCLVVFPPLQSLR